MLNNTLYIELYIDISFLFLINHLSIRFIVMFAFDICKIFLRVENDKEIISDIFHTFFFAIRRHLGAGFVAPVAHRAVWFPADSVIDATSR